MSGLVAIEVRAFAFFFRVSLLVVIGLSMVQVRKVLIKVYRLILVFWIWGL